MSPSALSSEILELEANMKTQEKIKKDEQNSAKYINDIKPSNNKTGI